MNSDASIIAKKAALRAEALRRRDALAPDARAAAAEAIAARPPPVAIKPGFIVSGFMPIKSEINPLPLLRRYADAGAQLALPAIVARGMPLSLRAWAVGEKLVPGQWGIREPDVSAPEVVPDLLLVPLVAFDRRGHRIGYGAGYYDMTIKAARARKPVVAIGIAYAAQEVEEVPFLPHDARLDLVLTEREAIDCRGA
ncbi:MAG: 5-formyltetrahydrofolate cyclo-ligase [Xanthobacteraceae bacterium]